MLKKSILIGAACLLSSRLAFPAGSGNETFTAYSLTMNFSNATIWTVNGGPATLGGFPFISPSIVLHTDGAGKITGTGWFWIDYANEPYTAFLVDVSGKISSTTTPNSPSVTLTLKGSGYTLDGNGGATANQINARFTGRPETDPVANDGSQTIVGKLTGKITGSSPLGANGTTLNLDMELPGSTADAAFQTHEDPLVLKGQVLQNAKRMLLYNFDFNGTGANNPAFNHSGSGTANTNQGTYTFKVKGLGANKGWSLAVNGKLGAYQSVVRSNVVFQAPVSGTAKGKIQGQTISASTSDVSAEIITGTADDFIVR